MNKNNLLILSFIFVMFTNSCSKKGSCDYKAIEPCVVECNMFENFEDDTVGTTGNWQTKYATGLNIQQTGGNNELYVEDDSGASWLYNSTDFPNNLIDQGCKLKYDVKYLAGSSNSATTDNSIYIYSAANPMFPGTMAYFQLNTSHLVNSGDPYVNITVPLELATGTTLPSNAFGSWKLSGVTPPYSTTDITNFNNLIQNIGGIAFFLDEGSNPAEKWWFDNFCFENCCPNNP